MTDLNYRSGVVHIDGKSYPLSGPLRPSLIAPFSPKVTTGDTSKDDSAVLSTLIQSDVRPGPGLLYLTDKSQSDRVWFSKLALDYIRGVTLPPLSTDLVNPKSNTSLQCAVDYPGATVVSYFAFGKDIYELASNDTWGSSCITNADTYNCAVSYYNRIYFFSDSSYDTYDGSAWTNCVTRGARFAVVHDRKLWTLDSSRVLKWSTDPDIAGVPTWTNGGANTLDSTVPSGIPTSMVVYRNAAQNPAIYVTTTTGMYVWDDTAKIWRNTDLNWPVSSFAGKGTAVFHGDLYTYNNIDGTKYQVAASATIDSGVGLSRDDGVPQEYSGTILSAIPSMTDLYVLDDYVNVVSDVTPDVWTSVIPPFQPPQFRDVVGRSSVWKWSGSSWSLTWDTAISGNASTKLFVGNGLGKYRLYIGANQTIYYIDLDPYTKNPKVNLTHPHATGPSEHITPWFSGFAENMGHIAVSLNVHGEDLSASEIIIVRYATDGEDTWHSFPSDDAPDNVMTTDGLSTFVFGSSEGKAFDSIRFRFVLQRGSTTTSAPILNYWYLHYLKYFKSTYGYVMTLDLTETHDDRTPRQMWSDLTDVINSDDLVSLAFHDDTLLYGRISSLGASSEVGLDWRGKVQIAFLVPSVPS